MHGRPHYAGFTLIELLIVIAIVTILALAISPSIVTAIRNSQIRSVAAAWRDGLTQARIEAIRLNTRVTFNPTPDLAGWELRTDGGSLANYQSGNTLARRVVVNLSAGEAVTYDGTGRMAPLNARLIANFSASSGMCAAAGGDVRCLSVEASGGYVRTCDPAASPSSSSGCLLRSTP